MEINELDKVLEKLRVIESISGVMMLSMSDNEKSGDLVSSAYDTCLDLIGKEARQIRKLIQQQ